MDKFQKNKFNKRKESFADNRKMKTQLNSITNFGEAVQISDNHSKYKNMNESVLTENTHTNLMRSSSEKNQIEKSNSSISHNKPSSIFSGKKISDLTYLDESLISIVKENFFGSNENELLTTSQLAAIPLINNQKDVVLKSMSGTGKTLAYLIPIINNLIKIEPKISRSDGIMLLIIVPTKELARQTQEVIKLFCKTYYWIVCSGIYGSIKRSAEKAQLRKGVNIVVSTPGRLNDHILNTKCFLTSISKLKWIVIDEADMFQQLGYSQNLDNVLKSIGNVLNPNQPNIINKRFRYVLLSATLERDVVRILKNFAAQPIYIDGMETNINSNKITSEKLSHIIFNHNLKQKLYGFLMILLYCLELKKHDSKNNNCKIIVFFSNINSTIYHYELINRIISKYQSKLYDFIKPIVEKFTNENSSLSFFFLHGKMQIKQRTDTWDQFLATKNGLLFTTDVAARGLDFPSIDFVIQYDITNNPINFIHRIGRTARAGLAGCSITLVNSLDKEKHATFLKKITSNELINLSMFDVQSCVRLSTEISSHDIISFLNEDGHLKRLACRAFMSTVKSLKYNYDNSSETKLMDKDTLPMEETNTINNDDNELGEETKDDLKRDESLIHYGHIAQSMCLLMTPREIAKYLSYEARLSKTSTENGKVRKQFNKKRPNNNFDEFSGNIENGPGPSKIKKNKPYF